jgi:hypothetical protein
MPYLQCPECRLTVPAKAYYLRGDECPRCLTKMEPRDRFRSAEPKPGLVASEPRPSAPAP